MLIRILFITFLVVSTGVAAAQSSADLSPEQKNILLDKAQTALLWFRALGDEGVQKRTKPEQYREQISPRELLQAAAILQEYNDEGNDLPDRLLLMLPGFQMTSEEMFEIQDILGETDLPKLASVSSTIVEKIPLEAQRFREEMLNSAEKVVLYTEPATALDLMKAVDVLSVVGRPVLVRYYLRKFLNDEQYSASPEESAGIIEILGTQKLMQIAAHPEFTPIGKEAVTKIIDEAKKYWQDDAKIAEALKETNWFTNSTDSPQINLTAKNALKVLWQGENISVQQGFQKLGSIDGEKQADELAAVLLSLRPDMKEAFAAALNSENLKLRYHAARGLAIAVSQQDVFLLYTFLYDERVPETERENVQRIINSGQESIAVANRNQAAEILHRRGNDYREQSRPLRTDAEGKVGYWTLNEENIEYQMLESVEKAYKHFADRYFEQAYRIVPKSSKNADPYKADLIIAKIEDLGILQENLLSENTQESINEVERLLQKSLDGNSFSAAVSLIDWLGSHGTPDLVKSTNGKPRVLVQAVISQDRRVRFAALSAIMRINPKEPFAGSSFVAETLVWFSKSEGHRIILSGHNQLAIANQTASMLLGDGYKTDVSTSCRELFEKAAASPDVEMVFVDARVPQPPVGEFLQIMRQNVGTAEIPIAVMSDNERELNPEHNLQRRTAMMRFDRRGPDSPFRTSLSLNYPLIVNVESARWMRDDLLAKTGVNVVPAEQRLEQALTALDALYEIKQAELKSGIKMYHFDDFDSIVMDALRSENRAEKGLTLATTVPSAALQSAIYEMAANVVYPMELRESAGKAFESSVATFGVLLRGQQVQRLYDRYNISELEPKESQELLSGLIDVVEKKTAEK